MQQRHIVLPTLLALFLFSLVACQSTGEQAAEDALMDWSRLDTPTEYRYRMQDSSRTYGEMTQILAKTELDGRRVFEVTYRLEGGMDSQNQLYFDAETGEPIKMVATQTMQGMSAKTEMVYEDDRVMRVMESPAAPGIDTSYTDVPPNTKDWMQVGFMLQAMDLAQMDTLRIPFYQGFGRAFVDTATLVNTGVEAVEVPAGNYDAYRIHIDYAGAEADFFVQEGSENRVLMHQIPGRQGKMSTVLLPEGAGGAETDTTDSVG